MNPMRLRCWLLFWLMMGAAGTVLVTDQPSMAATMPSSELSREEIQHFFTTDREDSVRSMTWVSRYRGRLVHWTGTVVKIRHCPQSRRVELMIRVLPDSML